MKTVENLVRIAEIWWKIIKKPWKPTKMMYLLVEIFTKIANRRSRKNCYNYHISIIFTTYAWFFLNSEFMKKVTLSTFGENATSDERSDHFLFSLLTSQISEYRIVLDATMVITSRFVILRCAHSLFSKNLQKCTSNFWITYRTNFFLKRDRF